MTYGEKLIALGLNIAYYRKLRLLTQEKLAEKANVTISTIRKLENPNLYVGVTFEKLCLLATALDVTESELLDFRRPEVKVFLGECYKWEKYAALQDMEN